MKPDILKNFKQSDQARIMEEIVRAANQRNVWLDFLPKQTPEQAEKSRKEGEKLAKLYLKQQKRKEAWLNKLEDRWYKGKPKHRGNYATWNNGVGIEACWDGKVFTVKNEDQEESDETINPSHWRAYKGPK